MTVPIIAFFNNKAGVGTTSLVYHLAWMYCDLGLRVIAADLDPQANLTAVFLEENRLEEIWEESNQPNTIFRCLQPLIRGIGDMATPQLEAIEENLALLVGDLFLSGLEEEFSAEWQGCMDRQERSFRVISAFRQLLQTAAETHQADIILADISPNLGAINRAALMASDYVVIPLSPDLFSLEGLKNIGPIFSRWREEWRERLAKNPVPELRLPTAQMQPLGYIVMQHSVRLDRPVIAYSRWNDRIENVYREAILGERGNSTLLLTEYPSCLALLKQYKSLMFMAQEARKPMFHLKPADGAIGAHIQAVQSAYRDFQQLAQKIAALVQIPIAKSG